MAGLSTKERESNFCTIAYIIIQATDSKVTKVTSHGQIQREQKERWGFKAPGCGFEVEPAYEVSPLTEVGQ